MRLTIKILAIFLLPLCVASCSMGQIKKNLGITTEKKKSGAAGNASSDNSAGEAPEVISTTARYGFKSGKQIVNSYLAATGIPMNPTIQSNYNRLEPSLPLSAKPENFSAGNQSAIVNLASVVCNEFINNAAARTAFFGPPEIKWASPASALTEAEKEVIIQHLIAKFWTIESGNEEAVKAQVAKLTTLLTELATGKRKTDQVVKAMCTAVAASYQSVIF